MSGIAIEVLLSILYYQKNVAWDIHFIIHYYNDRMGKEPKLRRRWNRKGRAGFNRKGLNRSDARTTAQRVRRETVI